ncbi:MAG: histidine--tRNA ligase [Marinilabiliales bacterium]|nr:MAG: histidine--tRNA ligase [Marinilabiliales bacterium]
MSQKPSVPKGTRDFLPDEMAGRNHIFDTIRNVFDLYGYVPIETPAMENLSSLLGKYGEEGDKLLFRILNSGDFMGKLPMEERGSGDSGRLANMICDRGLRYDLTVPFARFVVQHRNELTFPFKRYQIQPVWRADRPQKGRYREFFQCDVDVIGSDSLLNEAELAKIIDDVFVRLNINVVIKLNNRKILAGIAGMTGQEDKLTAMTVAIDKLDKIGIDAVCSEMTEKGISPEAIEKLKPVISMTGSNSRKLEELASLFEEDGPGREGTREMKEVLDMLALLEIKNRVEFDVALARGLNYYTGTIFEVKSADVEIGSICGGGRYDDLTGVFGLEGLSGVGISFGADRIYDVLVQTGGFPTAVSASTRLMFVNFGQKEAEACLPLLEKLRKSGISAELYPDSVKLKKQMQYANNRNIPFVALIGEEEALKKTVTVKNMKTGSQETVPRDQIAKYL